MSERKRKQTTTTTSRTRKQRKTTSPTKEKAIAQSSSTTSAGSRKATPTKKKTDREENEIENKEETSTTENKCPETNETECKRIEGSTNNNNNNRRASTRSTSSSTKTKRETNIKRKKSLVPLKKKNKWNSPLRKQKEVEENDDEEDDDKNGSKKDSNNTITMTGNPKDEDDESGSVETGSDNCGTKKEEPANITTTTTKRNKNTVDFKKDSTTQRGNKEGDTAQTTCPVCKQQFEDGDGLKYHRDNNLCRPEKIGTNNKRKRKVMKKEKTPLEKEEDSDIGGGGVDKNPKPKKRFRGAKGDRTCHLCNRVFTSILGFQYHRDHRVCQQNNNLKSTLSKSTTEDIHVFTNSTHDDSSNASKNINKNKKRGRGSRNNIIPWNTIPVGAQFITKYGIVEVVADDRQKPSVIFDKTIDNQCKQYFATKARRDTSRKNSLFTIGVHNLVRRRRFIRLYENANVFYKKDDNTVAANGSSTSSSSGGVGKNSNNKEQKEQQIYMTQEQIWEVYHGQPKIPTPKTKTIASNDNNEENATTTPATTTTNNNNNAFKPKTPTIKINTPFDHPNVLLPFDNDPRFPELSYPDRIVECILIPDKRQKENPIHDSDTTTAATDTTTTSSNRARSPTRLFLRRRELTEKYNENIIPVQCDLCGQSFSSSTGCKYHKQTEVCQQKNIVAKKEREEYLFILDQRADRVAIRQDDFKRKQAGDIPVYPEIFITLGIKLVYNRKKKDNVTSTVLYNAIIRKIGSISEPKISALVTTTPKSASTVLLSKPTVSLSTKKKKKARPTIAEEGNQDGDASAKSGGGVSSGRDSMEMEVGKNDSMVVSNDNSDMTTTLSKNGGAAGSNNDDNLSEDDVSKEDLNQEEFKYTRPETILQRLKEQFRSLESKRLSGMYPEVFKALGYFRPGRYPKKKNKRMRNLFEQQKAVGTGRIPTVGAAAAAAAASATNDVPDWPKKLPPPPPIIDVCVLAGELDSGRYPSRSRNKSDDEHEDKCCVCKLKGTLPQQEEGKNILSKQPTVPVEENNDDEEELDEVELNIRRLQSSPLYLCDFCPRVTHLECIRTKYTIKDPEPEDDFLCHGCIQYIMHRRARAEKRRLKKYAIEAAQKLQKKKKIIKKKRMMTIKKKIVKKKNSLPRNDKDADAATTSSTSAIVDATQDATQVTIAVNDDGNGNGLVTEAIGEDEEEIEVEVEVEVEEEFEVEVEDEEEEEGKEYQQLASKCQQVGELMELLRDAQLRLQRSFDISRSNNIRREMSVYR